MQHFFVSMTWKTEVGTIGSASLPVVATSGDMAVAIATAKIRKDRRRRYAGGMVAAAICAAH